jgi:hypothetical protein
VSTSLRLNGLVRHLARSAAFIAVSSLCHPLLAQPEGVQGDAVLLAPPAPLSAEELQKIAGGPTLITFTGKDVPVQDVVAIFRKAVGLSPDDSFSFGRNKGAPKVISVDWKEVPFWDAAREVEALTGLMWQPQFYDRLSLTAMAAKGGGLNGRLVADTPYFKMIAAEIQHSTSSRLDLFPARKKKPQWSSDSTQLTLMLYQDPKFFLEAGSVWISDLKTSVTGLASQVDCSEDSYYPGSSLFFKFYAPLGPGLPTGTRVATLTGTVHAEIALSKQIWKLADLTEATEAKVTIGTGEYTFERAVVQGRDLIINLKASPGVASQPHPNRSRNTSLNAPEMTFVHVDVLDGQGHKLRRNGAPQLSPGSGPQSRKAQMRFVLTTFDGKPLPGPYSLEWTVATATRPVEIPLELKDLVIP